LIKRARPTAGTIKNSILKRKIEIFSIEEENLRAIWYSRSPRNTKLRRVFLVAYKQAENELFYSIIVKIFGLFLQQ
jgi:hypothetical protein